MCNFEKLKKMGSAISCEKCSTAETSSVINLSNDLILRMVEGVEPCKKSQTKVVSMEDSDWFEKLHCIDDAHSAAYGLTFNELDKYIKKVESILIHGTVREQCLTNLMVKCYKSNSMCSLKCTKEVSDFIDCIDSRRLTKLRTMAEKAEQQRKEQAKK